MVHHGIHTAAELMASGLGRSAITYRTRTGTLHRLLPGVYASTKPDYFGLCAAVIAWKPTGILSHRTATWLWGLTDDEPEHVDVTLPITRQSRAAEWVLIHRRTLTEVPSICSGLPVVSMEQAFVDAAVSLDADALEGLVDRALGTRIHWRTVANHCAAASGMHGVPAVREQLRKCCPQTLSEVERIVARALTSRNFRMEINAQVGPYYGDLVDYRARVVVEIDGREYHSASEVFNSDRRRQNALVLDGWLVLRYSAATAMAHLDQVVDEIIGVVRRRRKSINSLT